MYKFFGHDNWNRRIPNSDNFPYAFSDFAEDNVELIIIRNTTFFYVEQKTTLGALKKQYTKKAIDALEHDGFIKFIK